MFSVAGDYRLYGLTPHLGPQVREHGLEIAFRALLTCELQVALEFAAEVAFQHLAGDLLGHDLASDGSAPLLLLSTSRGESGSGEGTASDCDPHEHAAYKSARSCRLPSLASYFILRFAVVHTP